MCQHNCTTTCYTKDRTVTHEHIDQGPVNQTIPHIFHDNTNSKHNFDPSPRTFSDTRLAGERAAQSKPCTCTKHVRSHQLPTAPCLRWAKIVRGTVIGRGGHDIYSIDRAAKNCPGGPKMANKNDDNGPGSRFCGVLSVQQCTPDRKSKSPLTCMSF